MITFLGPEGAGKTTVAQLTARRLGGIALIVPEWPSLSQFLDEPHRYALQSQQEALQMTIDTFHRARRAHEEQGIPLCMDMDPTRIRIHSQVLYDQGYLTDSEWAALDYECVKASAAWPRHYVYLRANVGILLERLQGRGRIEDAEHNAPLVAKMHAMWEGTVMHPGWRADKNVLNIDNTQPLDRVVTQVAAWAQDLPVYANRPTIEA